MMGRDMRDAPVTLSASPHRIPRASTGWGPTAMGMARGRSREAHVQERRHGLRVFPESTSSSGRWGAWLARHRARPARAFFHRLASGRPLRDGYARHVPAQAGDASHPCDMRLGGNGACSAGLGEPGRRSRRHCPCGQEGYLRADLEPDMGGGLSGRRSVPSRQIPAIRRIVPSRSIAPICWHLCWHQLDIGLKFITIFN